MRKRDRIKRARQLIFDADKAILEARRLVSDLSPLAQEELKTACLTLDDALTHIERVKP